MLTITYPTGEVVTQTYNGRGLNYSVSGSVAATLVSSAPYNQLGEVTRINLGNSTYSTFTYYGLDNSTGYYGRPWQIKTTKAVEGDLQTLTYTWDANGNLTERQGSVPGQTENFTYDFLDRLTGVSGAYSNSYTYNTIGNITSMNGASYTYGTKPHAVTAVDNTTYTYDANGNMTTRGSQTLTWDVENRLVGVTGGGVAMSTVYDGNGNRVKKTETGETIVYINLYYEKNLTTGVVTTHYYLGTREIAYRNGTTLEYVSQDHLGSTSVTTDTSGNVVGTVAYFPFGGTRTTSGTLNTDKRFTGQRPDQTGLYFYNARYYDATIGRFISADSKMQTPLVPQCLNRYSYCLNNPLMFVDPSGHQVEVLAGGGLLLALAVICIINADAISNSGDPDAATTINAMIDYFGNVVHDYVSQIYDSATDLWHTLTDWFTGWQDTGAAAREWEAQAATMAFRATLADYDVDVHTGQRVRSTDYRFRWNIVYELRAMEAGWYPCLNGSSWFWGAWLNKGEVWKIGRTSQFDIFGDWAATQRRYTLDWLASVGLGLYFWPTHLGTFEQVVDWEQKALREYYKEHGHLPPGNLIFA